MKKTILLLPFTFLILFIQAQTVTYPFVSGPAFKSFDAGPAEAGTGWNTLQFNDSGWSNAFNGDGVQGGSGGCAGANSSAWHGGDTIIWSSALSLAPDTACFRRIFRAGHCGQIMAATFSLLADDYYLAYINGRFLGRNPNDGLGVIYTLDSTQLTWLTGSGDNIFAFEVVNSAPNCAELDITGSITVDTSVACKSSGINEIKPNLFSVYPNPANNLITISVNDASAYSVALFDMIGNKILDQQGAGLHTDIDISHIPTGVYILEFTDSAGNISNKKVTKE